MWFGILGPLSVRDDADRDILVPAGRQRTVLATLLLHANHPVPLDTLADVVWDGAPPSGALTTLRNYVLRLRRTLGPDVAARILTRDPGYLVKVGESEVDVQLFEALCRDAGTSVRAQDWPNAKRHAAAAVELWRAAPLIDVPSQTLRDAWTDRLDQLWLQAVEWRTEARLRTGDHDQLVPELRQLTAQHPLHEHFHGQLIQALAYGGRQAEALAAYQHARQTLVDELGVEPSAELTRLQQQILDRTIQPDTPPPPAAPAVPVAGPRQLPTATRHFAGREHELRTITGLLSPAVRQRDFTAICAISGTGGVGKTTLALHWAHRHAEQFPDGQLYVNLKGFDPAARPTTTAVALRGFLSAMGADPGTLPSDVEGQAAQYRSLTAGRRMLVVLDNARDTAQVMPLLPGGTSCAVLITGRHRLSGLATAHGADLLDLDVLSDAEAHELLVRQLGPDRLAAEPDATAELLAACAGLPLALSIVAASAARHPDFTLMVLADELRDASARLDVLDAGDLNADLRAVLSWSHQNLGTPAIEVFLLWGLVPGPDIGVPAVASLTGQPASRVRAILRELEDASLAQQYVPGRYRRHDLIHLYATEQAARNLPAAARTDAVHRLVDHYLHTARAADWWLSPTRDPIEPEPAAPGCVPERLGDQAAALRWLDANHQCVIAVQQLAETGARHTSVWQLAWALDTFHWRRGLLHDHADSWQRALAATEQLSDPAARALVHLHLGRSAARVDRLADAVDHLRQALTHAELTADARARARTHYTLAWVSEQQGDVERALVHATEALDLFQAMDDPLWHAEVLNAVGWYQARLDRYDDARAACEQALAIARAHHLRNPEPDILDSLGYIAQHAGRPDQAVDYYQQALPLYRDLGHAYQEATTLTRLGDAHAALHRYPEAREAWQSALDLYGAQGRGTDVDQVEQRLHALDARRNGRRG